VPGWCRTTSDSPPDRDIQAIITVLRWRTRSYAHGEPKPLDMHETNLMEANLTDAILRRAELADASLVDTNLTMANLTGTGITTARSMLSGLVLLFLVERALVATSSPNYAATPRICPIRFWLVNPKLVAQPSENEARELDGDVL
jgi:hypothetical protein